MDYIEMAIIELEKRNGIAAGFARQQYTDLLDVVSAARAAVEKVETLKKRREENHIKRDDNDLTLPCGHQALTSYMFILGVCSECNPEKGR